MTDQITDAQLVERYLQLKARKEVLSETHAAELKPYRDGMDTIENVFLARLNERGADNTKTPFGTAYKSRLFNVKIIDRDALLKFCFDNWQAIGADLLQVGAVKGPVKEYIEKNNQPPPGVEVTPYINVNITTKGT